MSKKQAMVEHDERTGALAAGIDYEADAGKGLEGADRDSYAIPFLMVLQPLSPQVDSVAGAKAGMFLNSVTNALYERPVLVPCTFQRRWIRWAPREGGGGFKGEFTTAQINEMRERGEVKELDGRLYYPLPDGTVHEKRCDRLSDTRSHFCLVLKDEADEIPVPMVFALASTGIKTSKNFISRIDGIKLKNPSTGRLFTPPSFSHMYAVHTVQRQNEKGKWWQPEIEPLGPVRSVAVYEMAKQFYAQVSAGKVDVAHDSVRESSDDRM